MSIFLNNKVGFKIATVDLSDHVTSFQLNRVLDSIEVSAMGDTSHKFVTGLSSDTITVSFLNDTAAGSVLATLQAAYGTTVAFSAIQDKSSSVSATNVLYTGTILVDNITDINGAVADEAMMDLTFTCNSKTATATTGTW
jgi:aconitase B